MASKNATSSVFISPMFVALDMLVFAVVAAVLIVEMPPTYPCISDNIVARSFVVDAVGLVPSYVPTPFTYTLPSYITSTAFILLASELPMPMEWTVFPGLPHRPESTSALCERLNLPSACSCPFFVYVSAPSAWEFPPSATVLYPSACDALPFAYVHAPSA